MRVEVYVFLFLQIIFSTNTFVSHNLDLKFKGANVHEIIELHTDG